MERRLDNVVHRLGFAPNRTGARQMVAHGHVLLNGRKCNIPSLLVKAGDRVGVKNNPRSVQMAKLELQDNPSMPPIPDFLERNDGEPPEGSVVASAHPRRRRSPHPRHPRATHHRSLLPLTLYV